MNRSVDAYSDDERVQRYDREMDLLHPMRHKMVEVALEVLPYASDAPLLALDLGIGTGFFASRFLMAFPQARVIGVDGSSAMLELARARLQGERDRVRLTTHSFESLTADILGHPELDVVLSAYALHHLDARTKRRTLATVSEMLKSGGWLINADLVSNPNPEIEAIIQTLRVRGIVARAGGSDPRFGDPAGVRAFLDGLEAGEGDQPLSAEDDLGILREVGLANATVFWQQYREVVMGGSLSPGRSRCGVR